MTQRRALITGVTGQDGYYLAGHLLSRGFEVYGMVRGHFRPAWEALQRDLPALRIVEGDLLDQSSLTAVLKEVRPDQVFNLGAITFVGTSWAQPALMTEVTGLGVLRLLEAIRFVDPEIRLVHASSSEMFGEVRETPQTELTPLNPRSPYGVAKAFAHHTVVNYRESYGLHASTAIMFNHESPRRGFEFVTRRVTAGAARCYRDRTARLTLGNLAAQRDWGWAPEYMEAMALIGDYPAPDDFVIATGETHRVSELCEAAFELVGLNWLDFVDVDESRKRPADVELLQGDARKAATLLPWRATVGFEEIVRRMVEHDLSLGV